MQGFMVHDIGDKVVGDMSLVQIAIDPDGLCAKVVGA